MRCYLRSSVTKDPRKTSHHSQESRYLQTIKHVTEVLKYLRMQGTVVATRCQQNCVSPFCSLRHFRVSQKMQFLIQLPWHGENITQYQLADV